MTGKEVVEAFPGLQNGLLLGHINALISFRQRFCGDVPGLLRPQQWVRVDLVPLRIGGAMILRDISAAMECAAASDARQAFATAVEALGDIGYARISVRETIENANAILTEWIGVDEVAIRRVRFSALLATAGRPAFAEALETALHGGGPVRLGSTLVTREGLSVPVTLSIAERRGAYASDGAVVVVSRT